MKPYKSNDRLELYSFKFSCYDYQLELLADNSYFQTLNEANKVAYIQLLIEAEEIAIEAKSIFSKGGYYA